MKMLYNNTHMKTRERTCQDCNRTYFVQKSYKLVKSVLGRCPECQNIRRDILLKDPERYIKSLTQKAKYRVHSRLKQNLTWIKKLVRLIEERLFVKLSGEERHILAEQLKKKLIEQPTCPFTGIKLDPGALHLDHKIPIAKRPDLALKIDNLQWVSKTYNKSKHSMTDQEFLEFAVLVVKKAGYKVQKRS